MEVGVYYDPRFPGMTPVQCISRVVDHVAIMCLIYMNSVVPVLPLFNHYGSGKNAPELCDCGVPPAAGDVDRNGYGAACNAFNFLTGVVIFETEAVQQNYSSMQALVVANAFDMTAINRRAYPAQFAAGTLGLVNTSFMSASFRASAYDFCAFGTNCSVVSMNSYDHKHQVSEFYLDLLPGSCADTVSSPYFEVLANEPMTKLTEDYYQCSNTYYDVVINSLGIATGTYSLVLPLIILVALTSASWLMETLGVHREYSAGPRGDVLDALALMLMLVMNKPRTRSSIGVNRKQQQQQKQQQLQKQQKQPQPQPQQQSACTLSAETDMENGISNNNSNNISHSPQYSAVTATLATTTAATATTVLHCIVDEMRAQVEVGGPTLDALAAENGIHGLRRSLGLGAHSGHSAQVVGEQWTGAGTGTGKDMGISGSDTNKSSCY